MLLRLPALCCILFIAGCTPERVVTLRANPSNAVIRVNDEVLGPGPIDHRFVFRTEGEIHRISAVLQGYKEAVDTLTITSDRTEVLLNLRRDTRVINVQVEPAPAVIKLDGQPISEGRVSALSREIELGLDERSVAVTRVLTAERENFVTARRTISALDRELAYVLHLEPMRKTVSITTAPPGAEIYLDEEKVGTSPHVIADLPFAVNLLTDEFIPRQVRAVKVGYEPVEAAISWDEGRRDYPINLAEREKEVRLFVDPPGATITIDGQTVANDALGVTVRTLKFGPINEQGDLKTYSISISKTAQDREWEPRTFSIAWEEGRTDYRVALKEVPTAMVPELVAQMRRGPRGWEIGPATRPTVAMREVDEPLGRPLAKPLTRLAKGTQVDTLALAPDGSRIVFTVLSGNGSGFRSQMFAMSSDGTGAVQDLTDGQTLDLMPSFTPSGDQLVFSSDRSGGRMQIWTIPSTGGGRPTRMTNDDAHGLWPTIDSDPRPRLFRQAMVEDQPGSRIQVSQVGSTSVVDLVPSGGSQPRISPRNDVVIFCKVDERTGKRDLYRVSDKGGEPVNLTTTPDIDEYDPSWSRDGRRIVFASDRAIDPEGRRNPDIWMMDPNTPDQFQQLTTNGSVDDSPLFDVLSTAVYFRSNRGGQWGIWCIAVK